MKIQEILSRQICSLPEKAGVLAQPFLLLLVRVVWGIQFFQTGLGKLNNLGRTTKFFESLDIPAPAFHACFVGGLECVGGLMLVAGLAARLISAPLAVSMGVALATAHREDFLGTADKPVAGFDVVTKFFEASPAPFLLAVLIVFAFGPGLFSLDAALCRFFGKASDCCAKGGCGDKPNA